LVKLRCSAARTKVSIPENWSMVGFMDDIVSHQV
jgi:hypothetical protein